MSNNKKHLERESVINRMVQLSIQILMLKHILKNIRKVQFGLKRYRGIFASKNDINNLEIEVKNRINELAHMIFSYAKQKYPEEVNSEETEVIGFFKKPNGEYVAHFSLWELKRGLYEINNNHYLILAGEGKGGFLEWPRKDNPSAIQDNDLKTLSLQNVLIRQET